MTFAGHYLDGRTAARRPVTVQVVGDGLALTFDDGATVRWPLVDVRQTLGSHKGEPVRLERGAPFAEAVVVEDQALLVALREAPSRSRRFDDPRRRRQRALMTAGAAVLVIAIATVLYVWGIPAAAAVASQWVPVSWEDRLGQSMLPYVAPSSRRCRDAGGEAVLTRLLDRLLASVKPMPYRFRVAVVDVPVVNALALPGGQVVLFRGLIEKTRRPEELAGVMAHEIQHVLLRHSTRIVLEHASTAIALTAIVGDVSGTMAFALDGARSLGAAAYSRRHEAAADAGGLRMLIAARIDPTGMIDFFDALRRSDATAGPLRFLASHPSSAERAATLRNLAASAQSAREPVFTEAEWQAVVTMCRSPRS